MNRLAQATSPYLLQHQDNPVDWWEWGTEPFAEAARSGRPVLLSVGYAACHWCHVMAHESFEDADVAGLMNELFVNIKVDREERPDVDHLYMSALQMLGQQGGWPMTMFLDTEGRPFWGGTYFPKEAGFGRPGFAHILRSIAAAYYRDPAGIRKNTEALAKGLAGNESGRIAERDLGPDELRAFAGQLAGLFDPINGGLRGAPKFPNPPILEALIRTARRDGDPAARRLCLLTLDRMARGGIHDHLGGGFARYSVDERWLVPHFEKMLYDNAQLLELFAVGFEMTGAARLRDAATGIVAWLSREMIVPEGAFASSLDADSEGEEGRFYVWSRREVLDVLDADGPAFARAYDVSEAGNFEGHNILNRLDSRDLDETDPMLARGRAALLAHRAGRIRPGLDDKVLADWNGLMIGALVRASTLLGEPAWIAIAARAFAFVADAMTHEGGLGHSWRAGRLVVPGFALDHAAMMRAALALAEATREPAYLAHAQRWRDHLLAEYRDPATGLLAMTSGRAEPLIARPRPTHDDAVPNANGVFAEAMVRLAQMTGAAADHQAAEIQLAAAGRAAAAAPLAHASVLNALDLHLNGTSVLVVQDEEGVLTRAGLSWPYLDRTMAAVADPAALPADHPARALADAAAGATALVCAGRRCSLPVTRAEALRAEIRMMLGRERAEPG